jgi:hypothetical protein
MLTPEQVHILALAAGTVDGMCFHCEEHITKAYAEAFADQQIDWPAQVRHALKLDYEMGKAIREGKMFVKGEEWSVVVKIEGLKT